MVFWRWKKRDVQVLTSNGRISGLLEVCSVTGKPIATFRGIPYAKPPVDGLRWKPPQLPQGWEGVLPCHKYSTEAPQLGADFENFFKSAVEGHGFGIIKTKAYLTGMKLVRPYMMNPQSEDCLYINVRTPHAPVWEARNNSTNMQARLPVLVYFHAGDHHDGAGGARPYYKSHLLATAGNVVLVTFNYRLGIFGHFTHSELAEEDLAMGGAGVSGNYSILDQVAALKWVRNNISAFGGDPNCVTICGSSAGGESVLYMMVTPLARGLFHRAIVQSPGTTVNSVLHLRHPFACFISSEDNGADFANRAVGPSDKQLSKLRAMSTSELQELYLADATHTPQPRQLFYPVVDGVVLPKTPFEAFWAGDQAPVPLLIGFNSDEGSLCFPVTRSRTLLRDHLYPSPVRPEGKKVYGEDAEQLAKSYDPAWLDRGETGCLADQAYLCDRVFGQKVFWLAQHHSRHFAAKGGPVFLYTFHAAPPIVGQTVGAFHGAEVPFVFGAKPWFAGGGAEDVALSRAMIGYWTTFAKSGDPNAKSSSEGGERVFWPSFTEKEMQRIVLDHKIRVESLERLERFEIMHKHVHSWIAATQSLAIQEQVRRPVYTLTHMVPEPRRLNNPVLVDSSSTHNTSILECTPDDVSYNLSGSKRQLSSACEGNEQQNVKKLQLKKMAANRV